jgi:hypothetical protein
VKKIPIVCPWNSSEGNPPYAAFIAALGFERRARFIAEDLGVRGNRNFACAFPDRKCHSYLQNQEWFENAGFEVEEVSDVAFREWLNNVLADISSRRLTTQRIAIDISSLSRFRIATIVEFLVDVESTLELQVDFLYAIAEFSPPPHGTTPNIYVGPALPFFAGWSAEPERPPIGIVGLGYEEDKALGAVEHVQSAEVWAFIPSSAISEYDATLTAANRTLLESIPSSRRLNYSVSQPVDSFITLESLVDRLLYSGNVILFPFGPKIFTLCSVLVACLHPRAAVWRVSTGHEGPAAERKPSGEVCGMSVRFVAKKADGYAKAAGTLNAIAGNR